MHSFKRLFLAFANVLILSIFYYLRRKSFIDSVEYLPLNKTKGYVASEALESFHLDKYNICWKGQPLVDRRFMLSELEEFLRVYAHRPVGENLRGTLFTHQFSLWCAVRKLKPRHIVESGIHEGRGTWILRQAAPTAQLILLDPSGAELAYRDKRNDTIYYKARDFKDFKQVDWSRLNLDLERSLVFFDDHQSAVRRTKEAYHLGFKYIMFDDNYIPSKYDNLSLKIACGLKLQFYSPRNLQYKDNFGKERRPFKPADFKLMDELLDKVIVSYMEFPLPWSDDDVHNNTLVKNNNKDRRYSMENPNQFFFHPEQGFNNINLVELDTAHKRQTVKAN